MRARSDTVHRSQRIFKLMMKCFLFYTVLLTSFWSRLSTTLAGSESLMAKEFTGDIVDRKDLAYVTNGSPGQTLDLYASKKGKGCALDRMDPWRRLSLWLQRGIPG